MGGGGGREGEGMGGGGGGRGREGDGMGLSDFAPPLPQLPGYATDIKTLNINNC